MRILLIEDERELVESLAVSLKERSYIYDVRNFEEAKREIPNINLDSYGLVILYCMSLSSAHLELCRDIGTYRKNLPVLVATRLFKEEDEVAAFDAGASGYISRPFSVDELATKIRSLIHKPNNGADKIFTSGVLKLDSVAKRVSIGTHFIQVTKKSLLF